MRSRYNLTARSVFYARNKDIRKLAPLYNYNGAAQGHTDYCASSNANGNWLTRINKNKIYRPRQHMQRKAHNINIHIELKEHDKHTKLSDYGLEDIAKTPTK